MKTIFEANRDVPLLFEADVVVVGGGPAGIGAALAAARNGAKTVLLEKYAFLGGAMTLTHNPSFAYVDDRIQGGLVKEIMDKLETAGVTYDSNPGGEKDHWSRNEGCIYFDGEYYKYLLDNLMLEAGVKIYYYCVAVAAIKGGNLLKGILVETFEGRRVILAKSFIDCTGIAEFAWKAGASVVGEEGFPDNKYGPYKGRHMGFGYGYFLRGFKYDKFQEFARKNPEQWGGWVKGRKLFTEAKAQGKLYTPRNSICTLECKDGRVWMLAPFYEIPAGHHPWHIEDISKAEVDMRKQAWSIYELMKENVPGFEDTEVEQTATRLMPRDGHRIVGEYILTEDDIRNGRSFEDSIACSNMSPDLMFPDGTQLCKYDVSPYDIPYRCLLSKDYENLLAAGGSISMDFITWAALRYCAPSLCMGQAAGTAAAIAAQSGQTPRRINVKELQASLARQGMVTTNKQVPQEAIDMYNSRRVDWGEGFGL